MKKVRRSAWVGEARVQAIIGAARGQWFTTVVTNLTTARALLDALGVRPSSLTTFA